MLEASCFPQPLNLQRELTYTSYEFQEGIPVHFDLPEPSPGTTVAVVDHNPSQVREHPGPWDSQAMLVPVLQVL